MANTARTKPEPDIQVKPGGPYLVDDELHISVLGLPSLQSVTLHTVIREGRNSIESCCCYKADINGTVDLYNDPSLSGSYTGVSPMGIFWSMSPSPTMRKGFRLMKKSMDTPVVAELSVYYGHFAGEDIGKRPEKPERRHVIERWYAGPGVTSQDVTDGRIRGKLFLPSGSGPFPGVIDMYGTTGGMLEYRAALLASRGIAALALPYFQYKDLPKSMHDIDLDYFIVGAFVSINGLAFYPGTQPMKFSGGDIPLVPVNFDNLKEVDGALCLKSMFTCTEKDLIPVWRHNPKVLCIVSEDDTFIPKECAYLLRDNYPKDKVHQFKLQSYPGAGHLLEPPYWSLCSMAYHKAFGTFVSLGGKPKPHADAQEDLWRRVLEFFHENLPLPSHDTSKL